MTELITLDNGLRIVLEENKNVKSCSIEIWIASGASYETPKTAGYSHFIEHMLFKGTEKRSALDISVGMDEIGGIFNAYTATEATYFYAQTLSEHSDKALDILCDMLCNSRLDEKDIEIEKGVIAEEIAMCQDNPEDFCRDIFYERVWKGSMLGSDILGTPKTVNSVTRKKLKAHLDKFFVPERIVIGIAGNFDRDKLIGICKSYFSDLKNTGFELNPVSAEHHREIICIKKDFMQNQLIMGFPGVAVTDIRREHALLISAMLGDTSSSRLFQQIREKSGLVYSIDSSCVSYLKSGLFNIYMALSEKNEKQAIEETLKTICEFADTVTEKELARAKEQLISSFVLNQEGILSHISRSTRDRLLYNREIPEDEIINNIRAVALDDIRKTANEIFDISEMALCVAGKTKTKKTYEKIINQFIQGNNRND